MLKIVSNNTVTVKSKWMTAGAFVLLLGVGVHHVQPYTPSVLI